MKRRLIYLAVLLKGITSVIAQTLLIRELFIVFNGNELTFGIILAIWLISGAAGSGFIANLFNKTEDAIRPYCFFTLIISIWLPIALALIRTSRLLLGVSFAEVLGINHIVIISALALSLIALCDGAMFTLGFRLISKTDSGKGSHVAKTYLLECLGVIIGGVSFTFILLNVFNSFEIVCLLVVLNLLCCSLLLIEDKNPFLKAGAWIFFIASLALSTQTQKLQKITLDKQWHKKILISYQNSVYGNIAVSKELDQFTIFYNGLPAISIPSPETYFTEDFIHIPMLTKDKIEKVLFVGHAVGGLLTEALKYPLKEVVYVEMDPLFIKAIQSLKEPQIQKELDNPRINIYFTDARNYVKTSKETFDCIFLNSGLPTSLAINRYYTEEFFRDASKTLKPDGILVLKTWGSLSYLSDEFKKINALLIQTLKSVFDYCEVVPGDGFNIIIASRRKPKLELTFMAENLRRLKLKTNLISKEYLSLRLEKQYQDWFWDSLREELKNPEVNRDLKPVGLYEGLGLYYSQFSKNIPKLFAGFRKVNPAYLAWTLFIFLLLWRISLRYGAMKPATLSLAVLSTGFFTMSIQVAVLFLFQSLLGYLFQWLAILTTSFMAGASLGAYYANKRTNLLCSIKKLALLEITLPALIALLTIGIITAFYKGSISPVLIRWLFSIISLCGGLLVGLEIPVVYALYMKMSSPESASAKIAGRLYCLDLIGACLGALIMPLILIPGCGIIPSISILSLFKIGNGWNILRLNNRWVR